jgi:hypothetical protein
MITCSLRFITNEHLHLAFTVKAKAVLRYEEIPEIGNLLRRHALTMAVVEDCSHAPYLGSGSARFNQII